MVHGLQGLDFTSTSSFKSETGEIFFGGIKGFNSFTSDKRLKIKQPIAPILTERRLLNNIITPQKLPIT